MKKKLTRILSALLVALMIIPSFAVFTAGAEEVTEEDIDISDIVNLYKLRQLDAAPTMEKTSGAKDNAEPTFEEGMLASESFPVTRAGDKYLYIGPCPDPRDYDNTRTLDYIVYWYNKDGKYTAQKRFYELGNTNTDGVTYGNIVGEFGDGSVILKVRISSSTYKYAAIKVPTTYADFMLVTSERPFTVEEYYAYADSQGWELDGTALRPAAPEMAEDAPEGYGGIWNYFSLSDSFVVPTTQKDATNVYTYSKYIPVTEGDVITMGAISTKETQNILLAYNDEVVPGKNNGGVVTSDFKQVKAYKRTDIGIDSVENIGYDYAIYSYTVPEGVSYVKVLLPTSTCANEDVLVTKNQPFDGDLFRETLEIPEPSTEVQEHPFNGKNALFIGDSIFYGEYDTPTSYSAPVTSFARRLALATGLIPTVYASNGTTIGKTGRSNVKYAWDLLRNALTSKKDYSMVVFQGGIYDARCDVEVGKILPVDTEREVLAENERVATFAGALQLMFYDAMNKWTEAEFYFVASYKTIPETVDRKNMSLYYAQAKALCEMYGIHYIDLYNDTELYTTFDYTNTELFADDKVTPNSETYDLIFPTVLRLFNEASPTCTEHVYSNACDKTCDNCGRLRVAAEHIYDNDCDNVCNICGATRAVEPHVYDGICDAVCNVCNHVREDGHIYNTLTIHQDDNAHWFTCALCGQMGMVEEHIYSGNCDPNCNICSHIRNVEHIYDNNCDVSCNNCGDTRNTSHVYDSQFDTTCNVCGEEREEENTTSQPDSESSDENTPDEEDDKNDANVDKENNNKDEEEHVCEEVTGFQAFINSIINFFRRLFGLPELCDCGKTIKETVTETIQKEN